MQMLCESAQIEINRFRIDVATLFNEFPTY